LSGTGAASVSRLRYRLAVVAALLVVTICQADAFGKDGVKLALLLAVALNRERGAESRFERRVSADVRDQERANQDAAGVKSSRVSGTALLV
jgi:hypothetical protein